jgi:fructose-1,6-bisphosphatase/inositol monophosphatase family enzyme
MKEVAAEEILPRFRRLDADDIREKGPGDLVTVADVASERRLTSALGDLLPGSVAVGEEAVAADPELLSRLGKGEAVWVIDPLDGTASFVAGKAVFTVIVALVSGGDCLAGWIYDPNSDELVSALASAGAWRGGERLAVAPAVEPPVEPTEMIGAVARKGLSDAQHRHLGGKFPYHGGPGAPPCAGRDYMDLASGARHFTMYSRLMPWDHVAGVLIHREAGGYAAFSDGAPYATTRLSGPLLVAPDEVSWRALHTYLFGIT